MNRKILIGVAAVALGASVLLGVGAQAAVPVTTLGSAIPVGIHPSAVAITPDGRSVITTNYGDGTVSIIDAKTEILKATVYVGPSSGSVAISPDSSKAYVTTEANSSLTVLEPHNGAVLKHTTVGSRPMSVAFSPDGTKAYVANKDSNDVSIIDVATNTVRMSTISLPSRTNPHSVVFSPDGKIAYVVGDYNNLCVIDVATDSVTASIVVDRHPQSVAFSRDGKTVYVTTTGDALLDIVDVASMSKVSSITIPAHAGQIAFTPNGTDAYIAGSFGAVEVIDLATNLVLDPISVPTYGTTGLAISPDGTKMFVSARGKYNNDDDTEAIGSVQVINLTAAPTPTPTPTPTATPAAAIIPVAETMPAAATLAATGLDSGAFGMIAGGAGILALLGSALMVNRRRKAL